MKMLSRLGFFGALSAAVSALFGQTKIEACAPVWHQMPKPCEGQCPACGLAHGALTLEDVNAAGVSAMLYPVADGGLVALGSCKHCRNAFWRPLPTGVKDAYLQQLIKKYDPARGEGR